MSAELQWTSASRTDVGLVREINEDDCLALPHRGLWAVADGMGGHSAGDLASRTIVQALERLPAPATLADFIEAARTALDAVNVRLRVSAAERGVRLIGSTVAVLLASGRQCGWLWAGDSRIYLYRDAHLTQLTLDHSHVAELQAQGHLSAQQARHHPSQHVITRAVGAAEQLHLDERRIDVCDGDMFLLCSDGLSNEMDEADISAALACGDCAHATDALVDLALREGGRDNVTCIVIRADDPEASDRTLANPAVQR
ncbi:PP2C-family Ser/Thr phosphatase [Burkholderia lata]|uniref:PP2C family protein-serine/threonine phosphatase n=1 Tax=Burkholderia lata (strain ATCC 17760 / DSM 23089 / LMG 22485 / NCIMB 9086 / R18194 / 383) TaxID=482957 RepID=UPI001452A9F4|nr:protein phosphatase 2C domain-containing protein [Burkholderia lata]VWC74580.1 PP2C-family Ser/Thr phosphatase [Burkholderia lata]